MVAGAEEMAVRDEEASEENIGSCCETMLAVRTWPAAESAVTSAAIIFARLSARRTQAKLVVLEMRNADAASRAPAVPQVHASVLCVRACDNVVALR